MAAKRKNSDLTVQAKDTYDPADYITVHRQFFDGLRNALRRAHGGKCICIYCGTDEQPRMETPAECSGLCQGHSSELSTSGWLPDANCPLHGLRATLNRGVNDAK